MTSTGNVQSAAQEALEPGHHLLSILVLAARATGKEVQHPLAINPIGERSQNARALLFTEAGRVGHVEQQLDLGS